jgi:hypothetical protein
MEIDMIEHDRHLFIIGHNVFKSIDVESIEQTTRAMTELGIYHPPFKKIDIRISTTYKYLFKWCDLNMEENFNEDQNVSWAWRYDFTRQEDGKTVATFEIDQGFGFKNEEYLFQVAYKTGLFEKIMKEENMEELFFLFKTETE